MRSLVPLVLAVVTPASLSQTCFESEPPLPIVGDHPTIVALGDFDGDGDLDQGAFAALSYGSVSLRSNLGAGGWTSGYQVWISFGLNHFDFLDVDADGICEIVATSSAQELRVMRNTSGGWAGVSTAIPWHAGHFAAGDLDGDGDLDLALGAATSAGMSFVLFNQGAGTFVAGPGIVAGAAQIAIGDFDGDGDLDLAIARGTSEILVVHNDGQGSFSSAPVPVALAAAPVRLLAADFDGDGRADLAASQAGQRVSILLANAGGFAPYVEVPIAHAAIELSVGDLDADGDLDLVVSGGTTSVLANSGNGAFVPAGVLHAGSSSYLDVGDLDGDGDLDLAFSDPATNSVRLLRNCVRSGTPTCFGDGSGTACPCGNASAVGAVAGCLHSLGAGGTLRASGAASLAADSLVLRGASMPNAPALYFQGTSARNAGQGSVFGDGLRCAAGTVTRLGIATNVAGGSRYPDVGQESVSVRGAVAAPGERHYQVWYRNSAAFCTPSGFNLTNSLRITWRP
ncbi:MAG: VCBS repeat-containing protein [Planctomycetes bacterium]|nr:VCBS repeat-containing protein [Planctomycetota bacterium]